MSEISTGAKRPRGRGFRLQAKHFFAYPDSGADFASVGRQFRSVAFFFLINLASFFGVEAHAAGDCGTVIFPPLSDITSFNPLFADTIANTEAGEVMFMDLIWINRFGRIDWSRSLASAIEVSGQGQVYDVTLRPWHWSDGVPVTTADVLYDFSLMKALGAEAGGSSAAGMPGIIKSMVANDATHLTITLTAKVNPTWFLLNGLYELQPLPAHAWSHYTLDQLFQGQTTLSFFNVVDGPLQVKKFDYGSDAIFMPNHSYPGPKLHLSRFIFKFIETDGESVQQVQAGDADLVLLPMELWKGVHNMPGTRVEQLDPANGFNAIALNFQNPEVDFFQDVRVREAMQDAGDQKTLVKDVLHGFGAQVYTAIPTGDNEFLDPQLARQYPVGYDPAKARALLEQAGYRPGPDGIMQKGGRRLEFTVLLATGSEEFTEMTEFMQANLRAVGIQMDLKFMDFNTILGLVNGAPSGWQATVYEFFSGNYPSGDTGDTTYLSGNNHENYSDPEMDRHIHDSMYKPGFGGLYDYERYASAQQPSIFSVEQAPVYLVNDRLHGVNDFIDPAGQLAVDALNCTNNAAK